MVQPIDGWFILWGAIALLFLSIPVSLFVGAFIAFGTAADRSVKGRKPMKPRKPRLVETGRRDDEAA